MAASRSRRSKSSQEDRRKHFEHVADAWQQARSEVLRLRHRKLKEKVQLQHQLLQALDHRADLLRQQEQQHLKRKRQAEKREKRAKETALRDTCHQSLAEDKSRAAEQRREVKKNAAGRTFSVTDHAGNSAEPNYYGQGQPALRPRDSQQVRHSGYLPSHGAVPGRPLPASPVRELQEEEGEAASELPGWGSAADVPWYQRQLYKMYGTQADYFLHPPPAPDTAPRPAKALPATPTPHRRPAQRRLQNLTVGELPNDETGHIGAGELWETLRKDSMSKLIKNDRKFPPELKAAFSSFVRERLTNHAPPVQRSFRASEDVPDIERLMDHSKLRRTRLSRHKTELMYRSSVTNQDRTAILLNDSPMPDVTEIGGQAESISRYLPSWTDNESEVSEAEYMKWIKPRNGAEGRQLTQGKQLMQGSPQEAAEEEEEEEGGREREGVGDTARRSAHSRQLSETTSQLHNIWHSIASGKKKPRTPRYHFLTEKETTELRGEFSQRFLEEREKKDKPQPHRAAQAHSSLEWHTVPRSTLSASDASARVTRGRSALAGQLHRYVSDWEPLSMNALAEYKQELQAEGEGDFDNGRLKMWPAQASVSS